MARRTRRGLAAVAAGLAFALTVPAAASANVVGDQGAVARDEVPGRLRDHLAVELRHEHVALELEHLGLGVLVRPRLGGVDLVHAVGLARPVDDVGEGRPVVVRCAPDPETREGGRRRRLVDDVGRHPSPPVVRGASNGLR